ncbi:MAG TPA: hypothetical protein DIW47_08020 [Bacteroidetes bacterium]|nr:hypothetical protein [Bacteroidota bacterium]
MFKNLFNRKSKYQAFWEWFEGFEEVMFNKLQGDRHDKPMFAVLDSHIREIHPELDFEFGFMPGKIELVVSANGVKAFFPEVQKLVDAAPEFDRWEITAFKQRLNQDHFDLDYGGIKLGYDDIFFQYDDSEDQLDIQLNIRNFEDNKLYQGAVFRLLDSLLGEQDVSYGIGQIDWEVLDEDEADSLIPFIQLRDLVDSRK